jgi:hypothetical protein
MAYYSDVADFVSGCARIARSFSWRDAKDALSNPYINIHLDDYHIIFGYTESTYYSHQSTPCLKFDVLNKETEEFVARVIIHEYDGDKDDLPIIPPSKADRIASEITEAILRDEETQE